MARLRLSAAIVLLALAATPLAAQEEGKGAPGPDKTEGLPLPPKPVKPQPAPQPEPVKPPPKPDPLEQWDQQFPTIDLPDLPEAFCSDANKAAARERIEKLRAALDAYADKLAAAQPDLERATEHELSAYATPALKATRAQQKAELAAVKRLRGEVDAAKKALDEYARRLRDKKVVDCSPKPATTFPKPTASDEEQAKGVSGNPVAQPKPQPSPEDGPKTGGLILPDPPKDQPIPWPEIPAIICRAEEKERVRKAIAEARGAIARNKAMAEAYKGALQARLKALPEDAAAAKALIQARIAAADAGIARWGESEPAAMKAIDTQFAEAIKDRCPDPPAGGSGTGKAPAPPGPAKAPEITPELKDLLGLNPNGVAKPTRPRKTDDQDEEEPETAAPR